MLIIATFRILIALMLLPMLLVLRAVLPKGFAAHLLAHLVRDIILGIWHRIFGPKKVQIANRKPRLHSHLPGKN